MNTAPLYENNEQRFKEFYELQCLLTKLLSDQPLMVKEWLVRLPVIAKKVNEGENKSMHWRATKLNFAKRRYLGQLIEDSLEKPDTRNILSRWLIRSMPVGSYLEIVSVSGGFNTCAIRACVKQMIDYRDALFSANLGLAYSIARREHMGSYDDRFSDATKGLLDAVDRFVPLEKHVQFSYFATYWIKFQISRGNQKCQSVVAFPINQQRVKAKTERLQMQQEALGLKPLSYEQLARILNVKVATVINSYQKPVAISINTSYAHEEEMLESDYALCDPAPKPDSSLDRVEVKKSLQVYFRKNVGADIRVILCSDEALGSMNEALLDYIDFFDQAMSELLKSLSIII